MCAHIRLHWGKLVTKHAHTPIYYFMSGLLVSLPFYKSYSFNVRSGDVDACCDGGAIGTKLPLEL